MAKVKGEVWGWCVLVALGSLAWPILGQGCKENLSNKVSSFATDGLQCQAYTVISNQYYIWGARDNATQVTSLVVAVPLTPGNWAGIAFSSRGFMVGSTALVATFNSSGVAVATVYNLKAQDQADVTPGPGLSYVGPAAEVYYDPTSKYAYMFCQVDLTKSNPANPGFLLMSYGVQGTGTTIQQHGTGEHISVPALKFSGVAAGRSAVSEVNRKRKIHGSLNILGWGLLLPIGAMVARYARDFDPAWFYAHIAFQIVGFACIVAGVVTGVDVAKTLKPDQLDDHRGLGIFLLVLASLQVLAVVLRPKKEAKVRKYWNWYHHWVGRLALFLAVINIFVGLHMSDAERDFKVGYISVLSIELCAFVILETLLWLRWNRKPANRDASQEEPNYQYGGSV